MILDLTALPNYYEQLGVSRSADNETLRSAFCRLSKTLHPDTTSLPPETASEKFQALKKAYEILSDPALRKTYDESLDLEISIKSSSSSKLMETRFKGQRKKEEVRRPLSGGELFSLLLLGLVLCISLLVAGGISLVQGRELQVRPSWLIVDWIVVKTSPQQDGRSPTSFFGYPTE